MKYNFDEMINRNHTDSYKYDFRKEVFGTDNILPMWVADMDFRTPDIVFDAIKKRSVHPVLGYTALPKDYFAIIKSWIKRLHQWEVKEEWMGFLPGIVPGLSFAVQAFTEADDEIIVQPPVYHPFMHVVEKNDRKLVYNPLKVVDGRFEMDFNDLENKITNKTRLLILCNPHNPGGRVWDRDTLVRLADLCASKGITVVSDEIHSDMALDGYKHIPFASVSDTAADITVTYMAPSKTFNMPGLITSYYIISNSLLRRKLSAFLKKNDVGAGNVFAYAATMAVYQQGNEWREQMLRYVKGNIDYVTEFLKKNIPQIEVMVPEASFLMFLDCRGLGLEAEEIPSFFITEARLGLNDGRMFGPGGEYWMRMNIGCPRYTVTRAMSRLQKAIVK